MAYQRRDHRGRFRAPYEAHGERLSVRCSADDRALVERWAALYGCTRSAAVLWLLRAGVTALEGARGGVERV